MSHVYRFFGGFDVEGDETITLSGEEAHHALHVVLVKVGDLIGVFTGRAMLGRVWWRRVRARMWSVGLGAMRLWNGNRRGCV